MITPGDFKKEAENEKNSNLWKAYTDRLMESKEFSAAGIYGKDGTQWAISTVPKYEFAVTPFEVRTLRDALSSDTGLDNLVFSLEKKTADDRVKEALATVFSSSAVISLIASYVQVCGSISVAGVQYVLLKGDPKEWLLGTLPPGEGHAKAIVYCTERAILIAVTPKDTPKYVGKANHTVFLTADYLKKQKY